jgi:hypothetical protein
MRNGEWKAATVLGGSLIEALLLWAVARGDLEARKAAVARAAERVPFKQPDPEKPESWDLIHYIEVARELGEISESTASEARLAKDFRNLIHPGCSDRPCDETSCQKTKKPSCLRKPSSAGSQRPDSTS